MNIYVGNLSYSVTEDDLRALFTEFGDVSSAKLIMDRDTGQSKGFGFVEMSGNDSGQKAIDELNGREVSGRALKVNEARPREDRPRRGGGGGYAHEKWGRHQADAPLCQRGRLFRAHRWHCDLSSAERPGG